MKAKYTSLSLLIAAAFAALPAAGHAQLSGEQGDLGFIIHAPVPPLDHPIRPGAPQPVLVPNHPSPTALPPVHLNAQAPANVPAAAQFLASAIADGKTARLSDLMMNPEFFAAAHAAGPQSDALRGQIDWLMLSGVILGLDGDDGLDEFDGMDGSDDLRGSDDPDEIFGESSNGIILGGPGTETAQPQAQLTPFNPSIILGGPGSDNLQAPVNGFVFGATSYLQPAPLNWSWGETNFFTDILVSGAAPSLENGIILGGPGSDNIQAPINGFVFGTTSYLK